MYKEVPEFLSTLPARGATRTAVLTIKTHKISIHAPREGSDSSTWSWTTPSCNFYPRSPRGERPSTLTSGIWSVAFLSTLPARGATHPGG